MRSSTSVLSVALAATLVLAACGSEGAGTGVGDGDSLDTVVEITDETVESTPATTTEGAAASTTEPAPDTTPETTPETTEPGQDLEADTAVAQAGVIVAADLTAGWTEAPRASETASMLDSALASCAGVEGDLITAADAGAASAALTSPDGTIVATQDIGVLATERDARTVVAFVVEPDVPGCFQAAYDEFAAEALGDSVAEGASFGPATATRLQVGSAGDATQAIRVVVPVIGDPSVVAITVDHVIVRAGRSLASLTFENRTAETTVETIDEFTAIAATRLAS
jgi:hypothetical protein